LLSDEIRNIEKTLAENKRPVAVGIPGYVLPMDVDGKMFLNSERKVKSIDVEPAGSIAVRKDQTTPNGWESYQLSGRMWGRARLVITYNDGAQQSIHYYITKPAAQAVSDLGNFLMTKQWFVDPNDPFKRSPSVMSYDRERDKIVTQDSRVWIAGLGDEGGSGSWLAAAMKQFGQPKKEEIAKYEQFIDNVLASPQGALTGEKFERFDAAFVGAGDTLAAALASLLAAGNELQAAVGEALAFLDQSLDAGFRPGMGHIVPDRFFWAMPQGEEGDEEPVDEADTPADDGSGKSASRRVH
jgi:hypothetical protein